MTDLANVDVDVVEWKIEKYDNKVTGWKRFLPIQQGEPVEVITGGDQKPTVVTKCEPAPYFEWFRKDYLRRFKWR